METKFGFLEKEKSLLRSQIDNKQDMIQNLLKNNTTLVESINTNPTLPTQNKTHFIEFDSHEKGNKDLKLSRKIETLETIALSKAKMRDPQEKENRKKKSRKHIGIIGDSMVKHITGPGICKTEQVQVKTHPGATTDDIIDSIQPTIRQNNQISLLFILERMT